MTPEERADLNRAIANLFDRWQANDAAGARILDLDPDQYALWKRGDLIQGDDDLTLRLVLLLGIHVQLRALFTSPSRGYAWMNASNALFDQTPLNMIVDGGLSALVRLHNYLAAESQAPF